MAAKRRRDGSTASETGEKIKRTKFTIEHASLPSTSEAGVVLVTGAGDVGQLGLGPDVLEKSRFTVVNLEHEIVDVCAGGMHTVCLTKTGKVITFGCNDEGALGRVTTDKDDAEFTPGEVDLPDAAIQISAGDSHSAALLKDGRLFVWGTFRDSHGNMGLTPDGNKKTPFEMFEDHVVIKIASGENHLAILTSLGEVYTCGCAEQGQLGRTTQRGSDRNARGGSGVGQINKLLDPAVITTKVSSKLHFEDIWAGTWATFVKVAGKDSIYVFGLNNYSQLGLKKKEPNYMPLNSPEFSKYQWKSISNAQHHTIGLDMEGKVYAIGRKDYGRLGLGEVAEEAVETLTLIETLKDKKVVNIGSGSASSFAVTDDGELYCWGLGTEGQLGTGQDEDCLVPTVIKTKQVIDRKVLKVSGGGQHTVILAQDVTPPNNNTADSTA